MSKFKAGDYIKVPLDGKRNTFARVVKVNKNGKYTTSSYAYTPDTRVTGKAKQFSIGDASHVVKIDPKDIEPEILTKIEDKYKTMTESVETPIVSMAMNQKPEDFKETVVSELSTRLRTAISDARQEMHEAAKSEDDEGDDDKKSDDPEKDDEDEDDSKETE